jgi:lysophospholipase L1-like esterase
MPTTIAEFVSPYHVKISGLHRTTYSRLRQKPLFWHRYTRLLCAVLTICGLPATITATDLPPIRIVLVGDSTVTDTQGWGKSFAMALRPEAQCTNAAVGGRSSKSYRDEGRWKKAIDLHPDYVFIQFGHNDMPGKGPERETDPNTTYRENLACFIDEASAAGIKPILITSVARRSFKHGKLIDELAPYANAAKAVAAAKKVPLLDLHARSIELLQKIGQTECQDMGPVIISGSCAGTHDWTHFSSKGAEITAELLIQELRSNDPTLAVYLNK